jgi:TonB family protein
VLLERSPTTIDEYAAHVQNRLQAAAMQMRQQGTAELRLTIGKDGSIRQTEVVEVSGTPALRDQLTQLVNRIEPLPPLPGNADVLVLTTDLTFDYPGENLYDRYGRFTRSPN